MFEGSENFGSTFTISTTGYDKKESGPLQIWFNACLNTLRTP